MCKQAIGNLQPENVVLIFTHCDQDTLFDLDHAHTWYQKGLVHDNLGMPDISKERIFLFKGKDG